ncbi:MAG: F0F1 ATP synthase subunit A [Nitrospinaceae bacterium]|jgi:F-type H+-transporting ATPase subunit a|nr:F0F1 ATP synthase subunit A [Nitrospina sp.]MBT5868089.1 F0F1 ATP synthase subunit A [Nitrospinaceae bacterium]MBT6347512.1 F0F1 ATP synthase subunit A [Nitrospina sp.]
MESPLHHFEVHTIIPIHIGGLDLSINNAIVAMWVGLAIVAGAFMLVVSRGVNPVPGKLQSVLEVALEFIRSMVYEFIGEEEGKKYVPFIATLFLFILACNLIGLVPGSYTITSQVAVTGAIAVGIFIMTLVIGFGKHGMHFFGILVPPGIPKIMIPLMIPIEIISMLARPISLAVRLFANMTAGHTVLAVLFGLAMTGPLWLGWLPFSFTIVINGLEIAIAFIQAYIFTTLTCVYIGDVIKLH